MGSRLGRRVVHFANLPIKLLMPTKLTNIHEFALKTIPSATKIEIKRVLESLYGKSKVKGSSFVEEEDDKKSHWLDQKERREVGGYSNGKGRRGGGERSASPAKGVASAAAAGAKFPWSSMRFGGNCRNMDFVSVSFREINTNGNGKGRRGGGERSTSPARAAASAAGAKFPWSNMKFGGK
ncbi:hypothetical protein F2Q68_00028595 [Brassica cretica]|uniref:Uncharacterized protein n=1 Tax=Brassica cretica TaxID=69181 RepID=A0A8S9GAS0_BRACR|nr:hypothetical protein F2Q68_00028595 [Brassica cretica]